MVDMAFLSLQARNLVVLEDMTFIENLKVTMGSSAKLMSFTAPLNKDVCQVEKKTVLKTPQLKNTHKATLFFNLNEFSGLLVQ